MHEESAPLCTSERHHTLGGRCGATMALFFHDLSCSKVIRTTKNDSDLTPQRASSGVATRLCRGFTRPARDYLFTAWLHGLAHGRQHGLNLSARMMLRDTPQVFFERVGFGKWD